MQRIFDREYIDKPYNTNIEHLYDLAKIIDIKIVYYLEHTDRIKNKYISPLDKFKGLVISKEEIENIIADIKNDDKEEYPDIAAIIKKAYEIETEMVCNFLPEINKYKNLLLLTIEETIKAYHTLREE